MTASLDDQTEQKTAKAVAVCPKCKKRMDSRVARGSIVKLLLFWLPIRRYKCRSCNRKRYVFYS